VAKRACKGRLAGFCVRSKWASPFNLGVVNNSWNSWQIVGLATSTGSANPAFLWRNTNGDTELWNVTGSGGFTYQNLGVVSTSLVCAKFSLEVGGKPDDDRQSGGSIMSRRTTCAFAVTCRAVQRRTRSRANITIGRSL
jgi:hypothetical protein